MIVVANGNSLLYRFFGNQPEDTMQNKSPPYRRKEVIGDCTLYLGDCLDVLPTIPSESCDIAFTSPPYNLGEGMEDKGGFRVGNVGSKWDSSKLRNGYGECSDNMPYVEYVAWQRKILDEVWRITAGAVYYNHKPRVVKRKLRTPLDIVHLPVRQIIYMGSRQRV